MTPRTKKLITLALALAMAAAFIPADTEARAESTYTAPYDVVRIGLFSYSDDGNISERTFPSVNLENVSGFGYGYELGYYNADREFESIGAYITDTDEISMLMDKNMVYNASTNSYSEGIFGDKVVGCIHLRLRETYPDFASARARADELEGGFVRYKDGEFQVLMGQYTSSEDAAGAAGASELDCEADSGTNHTVTVVESRTNRILFEFDCGTQLNLAVRPIAGEGGEAQTWHRKCMYHGDFVILRNTGGKLTIVNYVDVETYLKGVVCYEMSPSWPLEALKAQAITARTYLMANITKHRTEGFDICNTIHCQAYHGTARATENSDMAVDETASQYLVYNGELCQTFYASSNGGASENSENVWNLKLDYLRGVEDPYERDITGLASDYYWTRKFTPSSLGAQLRNKGYNSSDVVKVDITYTDMGNVYSITFTDRNGVRNTVSKASVRTIIGGLSVRYTLNGTGPGASDDLYVNDGAILSSDGLSEMYAVGSGGVSQLPGGDVYAIRGKGSVEKIETGGTSTSKNVGVNDQGYFVFSGTGHGHNVGMSQWGAYSMAKFHGLDCEDILTFYYTGTEIVTSDGAGESGTDGGIFD